MTAIEQLAARGIKTEISFRDNNSPKNPTAVKAGLRGVIQNPTASAEAREQAAERYLEILQEEDAKTTA